MTVALAPPSEPDPLAPLPPSVAVSGQTRPLAELAQTEFQFIWRSLRRLGVYPTDRVDDAAQRVFEIATTKWSSVVAGKERAFLYRIAVFVAAEKRRARVVGYREQADEQIVATAPSLDEPPDESVDARRHRAYLDSVLDSLPDDLREVFVLFELERLPLVEIGELLDLKGGTVSSRLRRAREAFARSAERLRKKLEFSGDLP